METKYKTCIIFVVRLLFLTLPTLVHNKASPKKLVYLLLRNDHKDLQIPVCTTHSTLAIIFHLKIHESLMMNISSYRYIDISPKFHSQSTTNNQTETKSCYPEEIKQPGIPMIRIKCYMWLLSDKKAIKDSYIFSATYKNHTIWKYKRAIIPINTLFYCFKPPVYNLRVARRFNDNTQIEVSWTDENDVDKVLPASKRFLLSQNKVNNTQQHSFPAINIPAKYKYGECPKVTCKQIIQGLDQCKIYTICLQTTFFIKAIDAKYWPPLQITCVTSDEIHRSCSTFPTSAGINITTTVQKQNKNDMVETTGNNVKKDKFHKEKETEFDKIDILTILVSLIGGVLLSSAIVVFATRRAWCVRPMLNRNITIVPRLSDHINSINNFYSSTSNPYIASTQNEDSYEEIEITETV